MTPLNDEQLERIRHERKLQIIKAALKVFADNGIRLTKIGMIAAEAGISHGLVYHYFASKEQVLDESLEWAMDGNDELLRTIEELPAGPVEKIKSFAKFALTSGNSDVFRVIQHVLRYDRASEKTKALIQRGSEACVRTLYPLFVQGQAAGEIVEADPGELMELFLTIFSGVMMEGDFEWWRRDLDRKTALLMRLIETRP